MNICLQKSASIQPKTSRPKICKFCNIAPRGRSRGGSALGARVHSPAALNAEWVTCKMRERERRVFCENLKICKFLDGSFSAVSKPIFAIKYSLESSRRDLQDLHSFAPLRSQNFGKKTVRLFAKLNIEFSIFLRWFNLILLFFCEISMKFCRNFATNLRK